MFKKKWVVVVAVLLVVMGIAWYMHSKQKKSLETYDLPRTPIMATSGTKITPLDGLSRAEANERMKTDPEFRKKMQVLMVLANRHMPSERILLVDNPDSTLSDPKQNIVPFDREYQGYKVARINMSRRVFTLLLNRENKVLFIAPASNTPLKSLTNLPIHSIKKSDDETIRRQVRRILYIAVKARRWLRSENEFQKSVKQLNKP